MSIASLINRPCTLFHRTGRTTINRDGDEVPEFGAIDTVCELQQQRTAENAEEIADARWVAFFLPGETVSSGDRLGVDGDVFEVEGDPWNARNPRTRQASHVEATLRRTAGAAD